MIKGSGVFTFLSRKGYVNKDGESCLILNVLTKDTKSKQGFIIKKPDLIDVINSRELHDFQDIKINFNVRKAFNNEKRTSYWVVDVVGVE